MLIRSVRTHSFHARHVRYISPRLLTPVSEPTTVTLLFTEAYGCNHPVYDLRRECNHVATLCGEVLWNAPDHLRVRLGKAI